ncbi:MAG: hypothetical protein QNJ71_03010 [Acidimicrobiia bacterium]|nr:hypothetical protein [Acidimicrobiia bacterium]
MILIAGLLSAAAVVSRSRRVAIGCGVVAMVLIVGLGVLVVVAAIIAGLVALRRVLVRRHGASSQGTEELLAVEVTGLAVSAGLNFEQAAHWAASVAGGSVEGDMRTALRRRSMQLEAATGRQGIDAMMSEAERSATTGAPLALSLGGIAGAMRSERASASRERMARLPIKLLFPLALLTLPGFVLMAVGPAVVSGLSRLTS